MQQKSVPDEFANVGRFWGFWNHKTAAPDVFEMSLTYPQLYALTEALQMALYKTSSKTLAFINSTVARLVPEKKGGGSRYGELNTSLTAFGELAVKAVWDWIGAGFTFELKPTPATG
jgi:hypothetical protein